MGVLVLAVGRLALGPRSRSHWPPPVDPRAIGVGLGLPLLVLAGVGATAAATAAGHGVAATRVCVAALVVLAATLALSRRPAARAAEAALPAVVAPLAAWALVVSQTRSAWIGAVIGLSVVALLRAPRSLWLVGAATAAVLALRPAALTERLTLGDASTSDRYYMWQAGVDMVLDKPVFGQGPGMVLARYPRYRWPEATHPMQPHLHNNLLQIAAERGLGGLAFFLWWAVALFAAAIREARGETSGGPGVGGAAGAALAALAAVFAAGLFEYNLGDSEVLMLVLLLAAVPFALRQGRAAAA
jgi:O-antigen ligase